MVFVENSNFFSSGFFGTIKSEKTWFIHILDRKEWFLDQKINALKSAKKLSFS